MRDKTEKIEGVKEFLSAFLSRCSDTADDKLLRCMTKLIAIDDDWSLNQIEKFLDNIQK